MTYPVYATVHVDTGQVTFYQKKHGHVYLATLYTTVNVVYTQSDHVQILEKYDKMQLRHGDGDMVG